MSEKHENSNNKNRPKKRNEDVSRLSGQNMLSDRSHQFSPFRPPFKDDVVNLSCSRVNPNNISTEINFSAPRKFFTLNQDPFKNKENSVFEGMTEQELEEFALMCKGKERKSNQKAKNSVGVPKQENPTLESSRL